MSTEFVEVWQLTSISETHSAFGKWYGAVKRGLDYLYVNRDGTLHGYMGDSRGTYFNSKEELAQILGKHSHLVLIDSIPEEAGNASPSNR